MKNHKNKKDQMEEKNNFMYTEVPILVCFPLVENALRLLPSHRSHLFRLTNVNIDEC
jgi:hypothetical protein